MASDDGPAGVSGDPGMGSPPDGTDAGDRGAAGDDPPATGRTADRTDPSGRPEPTDRDGPTDRTETPGRDEPESPPWGAELDPEVRMLHDAEHALEWLQRARGHLLAFHHAVGRAMDKLAVVETELRRAGHDDLADRVRDDLLPAGVTEGGAWTFRLVEEFEAGPLAGVEGFESDVRERVADGERHVAERAQQERWRERVSEP